MGGGRECGWARAGCTEATGVSTAEARVGSGAIHDGVIYEEATEANARSWASLAAVRTHEGGIGSSAAAMSAGDSVDGVR